jgi:3-isopropylmalate/(R)-2-methylmalate dehydratase small subunit
MTKKHLISGIAAPLDIVNLDTDQIMPKQFLRGIDKAGLDKGLLWDLRFDGEGNARSEFVLNRPEFIGTRVLVAGPNFGCGSSREHAVWGLQQYGIQAVVAPSFGEIFYSNAMNNGLLAVMLPEAEASALLAQARDSAAPLRVEIDILARVVRTARQSISFALSERHRTMLLEGLDMIGASLTHAREIEEFAQRHWASQPWVRDVARRTMQRLEGR